MNAAGGPWPGFAMEQIMKTMNMVGYNQLIAQLDREQTNIA